MTLREFKVNVVNQLQQNGKVGQAFADFTNLAPTFGQKLVFTLLVRDLLLDMLQASYDAQVPVDETVKSIEDAFLGAYQDIFSNVTKH